jgi:hypothetical protein
MGSLSDHLRRPSSPKAALGARRYRVAVPRSTHNDPETWHRTRNRKPTHNTDTRGPETLAQHRGRDRNTCTRATASEQQTQTARTTRSGSKPGRYGGHHQQRLPHVAQSRTRSDAQSLSIGMVSCGTTSWHSGTNSATPTNAHCATKLTEAATSPRVAKTPS